MFCFFRLQWTWRESIQFGGPCLSQDWVPLCNHLHGKPNISAVGDIKITRRDYLGMEISVQGGREWYRMFVNQLWMRLLQKYSEHPNTGRFWYSDDQNVSGCRMVPYSNGPIFEWHWNTRPICPVFECFLFYIKKIFFIIYKWSRLVVKTRWPTICKLGPNFVRKMPIPNQTVWFLNVHCIKKSFSFRHQPIFNWFDNCTYGKSPSSA
jgi:hypothetical protein